MQFKCGACDNLYSGQQRHFAGDIHNRDDFCDANFFSHDRNSNINAGDIHNRDDFGDANFFGHDRNSNINAGDDCHKHSKYFKNHYSDNLTGTDKDHCSADDAGNAGTRPAGPVRPLDD